jgi:Asp-tRNA(Asn)/Glu-tRNA(Gln) amidotransferase A subunit family amidase
MGGVFPFVDSFDDIGPFAASVADLRLAWDVLRGGKASAASTTRRIARLGGWFSKDSDPEILAGIDRIAEALGGAPRVELPKVDQARSAAFVMTASEGGAFHLPALRENAMGFDPATRDRLLAGALLPRAVYARAQAFRRWFAGEAANLFAGYEVLLAPSTPCAAPPILDPNILIDGKSVPARANLGLLTQPLSFIGLPVIAAPLPRPGKLPLGIQIIGAPGSETTLFELAEHLERIGLIGVSAAEPRDAFSRAWLSRFHATGKDDPPMTSSRSSTSTGGVPSHAD